MPRKPKQNIIPPLEVLVDPGLALIGVKACPAGLAALRSASQEAWAYHQLRPYPVWGFRNWRTEDLGPLPRCMSHPKRIVRRGARFLFGKGIEISAPGNEVLEGFLREVWNANMMPARMVAAAEKAGIEGGIALKFAWDPERPKCPVAIQTLSVATDVQFFYDPHDKTRLLMARVQYCYQIPGGKKMWYREEWTATQEIHFYDVTDDSLGQQDPDTFMWVESGRKDNPFGLIPLVHVKNLETDDSLGAGDLWELYRTVDDINLSFWHQKRCNQFDSSLNPYFVDLELEDEDLDKPAKPGQPISLQSSNNGVDGQQGKVVFPDGRNDTRESLRQYAKDLEKQLNDAAGTVSVDQAEFTNKGNLTAAVLEQLYALLIETTQEKRKSYGQNGLEPFLEALALGLAKIGAGSEMIGPVSLANPDSWDVQVKWPAFFELSPEEKQLEVGRVQEEELAGYTSHERAIERIAQMNGITDIPALKEELESEPRPSPTEGDPKAVGDPAEKGGATK